jgi:polyisoprenyl-teichoic acid--peptidoglycan teichoic acid transferase
MIKPKRNNVTNRRFSKKSTSKTNTLSANKVGCFLFFGICFILLWILFFLLGVYLTAPFPTNLVLLGIDHTKPSNFIGRSDTIMLVSFDPVNSSIDLLSIPRDLWVSIPGIGENRINTVHFFAEANVVGSGPQAVMNVLRQSFGYHSDYYVRVKFESFRDVVDAMGGLEIELMEPTAGYEAGHHHLNGRKALAFARHRKGSDDFFRMERGQFLLKTALDNLKKPAKWTRIPSTVITVYKSIDTNIPVWLWPHISFSLLRFGDHLNNRTITREMVTPYTTDQGANILLPNWQPIRALINEMFGN